MAVLTFNSLVLIPSDYCNSRCAHCYPECGPSSRSPWDVETLKRIVREAADIPNLRKVIHFAGGEPFLFFPDMLDLAMYGQTFGFKFSVTTNGYWGNNAAKATEQIQALVAAGLYRIEVSFDSFHQQFIKKEHVRTCLRVLKDNDIRITLRVITTRKHTVDETLRLLTTDDLDGLEVLGSPMVPVGRAAKSVDRSEYYLSTHGIHSGQCAHQLNLTVRKDGNVSFCCAGSDVTPSLFLGSVYKKSMCAIANEAAWNPLVQELAFKGPGVFVEPIKRAGLEQHIQNRYTNICHACSDIFNNSQLTKVALDFARVEQKASVERIVGSILREGRPTQAAC